MEVLEDSLCLAFRFGIGRAFVEPLCLRQCIERFQQHFVNFCRRDAV